MKKIFIKININYNTFPQIFFQLQDDMWDNKAVGYD